MMLEELQRRHYSEGTTRYYIRHVERFARYFHRSPDRLGPQHIREYQAQLFSKQKEYSRRQLLAFLMCFAFYCSFA
jgi:integrase/recombinase XerD